MPLQDQKATALLDKLIWYYGLEQTIPQGYKPAILIQETYRRVASRDTFLKFFFWYIYKIFNDTNEPDVDTDISVALSYVDNLGNPARIQAELSMSRKLSRSLQSILLITSFFLVRRSFVFNCLGPAAN